MAAGVIQTLSKFSLPTEFKHPFRLSMAGQEMAFQYLSGEEDTEEEEGDEGEEEGKEEMELAEDLEEEEEESTCSTHEDFCSPPLSGQVVYYTDLIRISQRGETEDKEDFLDPHKPFEQLWRSLCRKDEKLGPLAELFEYGLCRCLQRHLSPDNKKLMRLEKKYAHVTPMQGRKLPQSFWREPTLSPIGTPNSNPPDFSDLLANWTSESGQEELNASREQLGEVASDGH
ncbi:protein PERCC1 [Candoia aspera]|uniref:protein PERCC1 n=1 Tax=Candoia aspera TaxID=51853 RepID=UPI002FD830C9